MVEQRTRQLGQVRPRRDHLACQGLSLDEIAWEPTRMENKDKHDVMTFLHPTFVALPRQLFQ